MGTTAISLKAQKSFVRGNTQAGGPMPKVSIITVCYNSASTIYDTLLSVARQSYPNVEHIIVDGGSTDATLHIVEAFSHVAKVISEKDGGIYDAMNKGLAIATGDLIAFLNSDDTYANSKVIEHVVEQMRSQQTDTLYANLHYVDRSASRVLRNWVSGKFNRTNFKFGWMPPHPTFFAKKEVYQKVGGFNLNFKSASDYELMLRILYKNNFSCTYLPEVVVKMKTGGVSNSTLKRRLLANREDRMAWKVNSLQPYFFTLYLKPIRKVKQYLTLGQLRRLPVLGSLL